MNEAAIYKALGDPVRLEMIKRLSATATSTLGDISTNLGMSRQGARKQLQILVNAKVVHLEQRGRQTHVRLDTTTLQIARLFITQMERQWDNRLAALKIYVEESD
jgi:DNA-binding transcriptional ArsR family regulator